MFNSSLQQQPDYPAALASLQHMDIDSLKVIPTTNQSFQSAFVSVWIQINSEHFNVGTKHFENSVQCRKGLMFVIVWIQEN